MEKLSDLTKLTQRVSEGSGIRSAWLQSFRAILNIFCRFQNIPA